ncbi:helix-turn-helix transcriptional regulator [Rossellomorea sp. NRS-1567]|uniref:helix-turn-helix transcriptional regulator n=1 Tax=Rossellomorea sp. NRS-1567 TaxID=3233901 RepID=UPI003D2C398F
MITGNRIKITRVNMGVSTEDVCKGILSRSHLSNIEKGRYYPEVILWVVVLIQSVVIFLLCKVVADFLNRYRIEIHKNIGTESNSTVDESSHGG